MQSIKRDYLNDFLPKIEHTSKFEKRIIYINLHHFFMLIQISVFSNSPCHLIRVGYFSLVVVVRAPFLPVKRNAGCKAQDECSRQYNVDDDRIVRRRFCA